MSFKRSLATGLMATSATLGVKAGADYFASRPAAKELRAELRRHEADAEEHTDWLIAHPNLTSDEKRALKVGYTLGQLNHLVRSPDSPHPLQTRTAEQVREAAEIRSRLLRRLHYKP